MASKFPPDPPGKGIEARRANLVTLLSLRLSGKELARYAAEKRSGAWAGRSLAEIVKAVREVGERDVCGPRAQNGH